MGKILNILIFFATLQIIFSNIVLADDRTELENIIQAYGQAMSASDVDAVMKLYTKNAIFIPSGSPTATGWNAVKKAYEHEFRKIDLDVKAIIDEITIGTDIAFARSRSEGEVTILATKQKKSTEKYRALFIFEKENGSWKISRFVFNFTG